jgi:hypothetical protein
MRRNEYINILTAFIRVLFVSFLFAMLALSLYQCNTPRTENERTKLSEHAELERNTIRFELRKIRNSIERELDKVEDKLEVSKGDHRTQLELADRKLKGSKAKVNKALDDIDKASEHSWIHVKQSAKATTYEVKNTFQQLAYDLDKTGRNSTLRENPKN